MNNYIILVMGIIIIQFTSNKTEKVNWTATGQADLKKTGGGIV